MHQIQNKQQAEILKALGTYKYLTYEQMIRLGIATQESNLSKQFGMLRDRIKPLAATIPNRPINVKAKNFLTKRGKEFLVKNYGWDASSIKFLPKIPENDNNGADHRTATIDCQIAIDLECENDDTISIFCDTYFDKVDDNPFNKKHKSKTAILIDSKNSIKADLVFMLKTTKQKELYFLEVENGKDSGKSLEKCKQFGKAIYFKQANEKYNFHSGYRTLWVFIKESTMKNTMNRMQEDSFFKQLNEYFLFKTISQIKKGNFFENWQNIKAQKRKLFYK